MCYFCCGMPAQTHVCETETQIISAAPLFNNPSKSLHTFAQITHNPTVGM